MVSSEHLLKGIGMYFHVKSENDKIIYSSDYGYNLRPLFLLEMSKEIGNEELIKSARAIVNSRFGFNEERRTLEQYVKVQFGEFLSLLKDRDKLKRTVSSDEWSFIRLHMEDELADYLEVVNRI